MSRDKSARRGSAGGAAGAIGELLGVVEDGPDGGAGLDPFCERRNGLFAALIDDRLLDLDLGLEEWLLAGIDSLDDPNDVKAAIVGDDSAKRPDG